MSERKPRRLRTGGRTLGLLGLLLLAAGGTVYSVRAEQQPAIPSPGLLFGGLLGLDGIPRTPQGYKLAVAPYEFQFPRDHAAHPDYQTEWWYYTGHLYSGDRKFGYELTFFQVGLDPRLKQSRSAWAMHTLYFAHFAVTDENQRTFRYTEQVSRPALEMAGADPERYHVWVHDWVGRLLDDDTTHHLRASGENASIDLKLVSRKPPAIHGEGGVSQKAEGLGRSSHYYSLTRLDTRGTLTLDGETLPVTGVSWMDHEFGSGQMVRQQVGWDWFSLQLEDGRELMLYVMRRREGGVDLHSSGTLVQADGSTRHLPLEAYRMHSTGQWQSPHTGATYPSGWEIHLPGEELRLRVQPTVADQELALGGGMGVTYWEGSVTVEGESRGKPVRGVGYVELSGYDESVPSLDEEMSAGEPGS